MSSRSFIFYFKAVPGRFFVQGSVPLSFNMRLFNTFLAFIRIRLSCVMTGVSDLSVGVGDLPFSQFCFSYWRRPKLEQQVVGCYSPRVIWWRELLAKYAG